MKSGIIALLVALLCAVAITGCNRASSTATASAAEKQLYTCGMHPQVIQDHPGNCPICGMKLTPIRKQSGTNSAAESAEISIDPVTVQNMGVRTGVVSNGPLRRIIRTVATVDYDETSLVEVTTKFKGWIEKLHVNATGQLVHRGDPLFEIYSPELFGAETEYVLALGSTGGNAADAQALRANALTKLAYFDVPTNAIAELEKTRQVKKMLTINAPRDGIVVEKAVEEGQMIDAGMKLFRLADLGLVWVQAQIYEQDLPFIRVGQEALVKLSYLPDRKFQGRVTYIYPTVDEKTRTAKVRMEFHNPGYFLKPGMFATVELAAEISPSALLVPDSAILRSGEKNTVFVALDVGRFEPRSVVLGPRGENDTYQVLTGLASGERVVTSGQFLLDSKSQLRDAIQKMVSPPAGAAPKTAAANSAVASAGGAALTNEAAVYVCPMPDHVSIQYEHPGNCPLCGMTLIPISQAEAAASRSLTVAYYTCPMPEHADVRETRPGKCPRCGMTLIPVMNRAEAPVPATPAALPVLYTCPMAAHAHVVSDKPGICPECEMDLVPTSTVKHGKIAEENWRKTHAHP